MTISEKKELIKKLIKSEKTLDAILEAKQKCGSDDDLQTFWILKCKENNEIWKSIEKILK